MSRKATEFQKKEMSKMYRGKEIFKPLQTGWIDEHVACVREWVANIFFYRKGDTTLMFDAGYNYDRLEEKMGWLGIDPKSIRQIFITHQDTDHVGAVEADSPGLFRDAVLYVGETENRYLTGEVRRKMIYHLYKLPQVTIRNEKVLLKDGDVLDIDGIRVECFLVPGHTCRRQVPVHRRYHLVRRGRRLQLYFRPGGGQQAGGPLAGRAGGKAADTRPSPVFHHRPYRLDRRFCLRLCPQGPALLTVRQARARSQRAL